MGQAKLRGSHEQRVEQAKARIDALRPAFIICNDCKAQITNIEVMDTRGIIGVDACFAGICEKCNGTSYAIKGTPEGCEAIAAALTNATGELPIMGIQ